jgi:hypothetical protein
MWLGVALCALGEITTVLLHRLTTNTTVAMLPQTLAHTAMAYQYLEGRLRLGIVLFCMGVWLGSHVWLQMPLVAAACFVTQREITGKRLRGQSRYVATAGLQLVMLYFIAKAFGVDRDLRFAPLFFALFPGLWLWFVWTRSGVTTFKVYILASALGHLVGMALFLVPHPPARWEIVYLAPVVVASSTLVYLGVRVLLLKKHHEW